MIRVTDLTKSYPARGPVVDHLSFEVAEGEALVLVGTSGRGKICGQKQKGSQVNKSRTEFRSKIGRNLFWPLPRITMKVRRIENQLI